MKLNKAVNRSIDIIAYSYSSFFIVKGSNNIDKPSTYIVFYAQNESFETEVKSKINLLKVSEKTMK